MPAIHSKPINVHGYSLPVSKRFSSRHALGSSHIDRLPMELTTEIFRLVVASSPEPRHACLPAFALATVNRSWRSFALGDPKLWSPIWFNPSLRHSSEHPDRLERGLECLRRAGTHGVDVRITDDIVEEPEASFTEQDARRIVAYISIKLGSIQSIRVHLKHPIVICAFLRAFQIAAGAQPLNQLQVLELRRASKQPIHFGSSDDALPAYVLDKAPSLSALTVDGVFLNWASHPSFPDLSPPPTFHFLSTLHLKNLPTHRWPSVSIFRTFLHSAQHTLRRLVLDGAGPEYVLSYQRQSATAFPSSIPLPQLTTLQLCDFTNEYAAYAFHLLDCPNLVNLTIHNFDIHDFDSLAHAMRDRMPRLKRLALRASRTSAPSHSAQGNRPLILADSASQQFKSWFETMPNLRFLTVERGWRDAFRKLTGGHSGIEISIG